MSEAAKTALINADSNRVGTKVIGNGYVMQELTDAGLITINDNLTRRGSIERERLVNAALSDAFGSL